MLLLNDLRDGVDIGRHHRQSGCGGLLEHHTERLVARGHHEHVRLPPQVEPLARARHDAADAGHAWWHLGSCEGPVGDEIERGTIR